MFPADCFLFSLSFLTSGNPSPNYWLYISRQLSMHPIKMGRGWWGRGRGGRKEGRGSVMAWNREKGRGEWRGLTLYPLSWSRGRADALGPHRTL